MPTNGNDIINVASGQNIDGLGGADEFTWLGGNATIAGGDTGEAYDSNVYMDKTGGDRLFIDASLGGVKATLTSTENGTIVAGSSTLKFTGIERLHFGDGNDTIRAGSAVLNTPHDGTPVHGLSIWAGGGDDNVVGSAGEDFIDGGSGNDTIYAGDGSDFIQSSTGNDLIYGGDGDDNIRWGQGNSAEIVGNDTIYGGGGNDIINVWIKDGYTPNGLGVAVQIKKISAEGSMNLSAETDLGGAHSKLTAQGFEHGWTHEGKDTVDGSGAQLSGSTGMLWNTRWGDDILIGTSGNDTLEGGPGKDTITGGAGNDLISANGEYYNLNTVGDGDADTLVFRAGHGQDTVIGFDQGIDTLDLGSSAYTISDTTNGTLLTAGQDSILLYGIHSFEL